MRSNEEIATDKPRRRASRRELRDVLKKIIDLGTQDIYTDAIEYEDRVNQMRELLNEAEAML